MQSAFDTVKKVENEAEDILASAREKIARLKSETDARIAENSRQYTGRLDALQAELSQKERQTIAENARTLDSEWQSAKKRLDDSCSANKAAVKAALVKKVIGQNGDS